MVDRDRFEEFRLRFGIEADPQALSRFRLRLIHAGTAGLELLPAEQRVDVEKQFAFRNGSEFILGQSWGSGLDIRHGVLDEFENAKTFPQLVERIQHLLWTFEELGYFKDLGRYDPQDRYAGLVFASKLDEAIRLSPGIDLRLQLQGGRAELAPAGAPLLDEVVDRTLQWLSAYPDVQKEVRQALRILAERKTEQYRQAQDSLRFGLEKLLKLLLRNNSRLEDQGRSLKDWLAQRGVHENLRDVATSILGLLTKQYQNPAVKHDNLPAGGVLKTWSAFEIEFVIYQHATLMRLLLEASSAQNTSDSGTA